MPGLLVYIVGAPAGLDGIQLKVPQSAPMRGLGSLSFLNPDPCLQPGARGVKCQRLDAGYPSCNLRASTYATTGSFGP